MSCRVGKAIGRAGVCVEVVVSGDGAGGLNRGLCGGLGGSLGGCLGTGTIEREVPGPHVCR